MEPGRAPLRAPVLSAGGDYGRRGARHANASDPPGGSHSRRSRPVALDYPPLENAAARRAAPVYLALRRQARRPAPLSASPVGRAGAPTPFVGPPAFLARWALPPDRVHGPRRGHELGGVDFVAFPLAGHVAADQRGDFLVRGPRAHRRLHVVFLYGEQAVPQLAIRGQTEAVAVQAEGLAHRGDEADSPAAIGVLVLGGGRARVGVENGNQRRDLARERRQNVVGHQNLGTVPQILRVERQKLDEARLETVLARLPRQRHDRS